MATLYHVPTSRSLRVLWTLEEISATVEVMSLGARPRLQGPEYLAINPAGTLPALIDGDRAIYESLHAVEVTQKCMRLDPFCTPGLANLHAHAHYMLEDYSAAQSLLQDSVSRLPNSLLGRCLLAATCAQLGRAQEAAAQAAAAAARVALPASRASGERQPARRRCRQASDC